MSQKGFSIIEILVATALIGTVVLGVFSLLGTSLKASLASNNMLIASMLAQEGIELAMNLRDTNWLEGSAWDDELGTMGGGVGTFKNRAGVVDYDDSAIRYVESMSGVCDNGTSEQIKENNLFGSGTCIETKLYLDSNNFYTHTSIGADETAFKRMVKVTKDDIGGGNRRLIITSIVRWGVPDDVSKEVRLVTYLYDWIPS